MIRMPKKGKSTIEERLHRVEGQIRGIEAMLTTGDDVSKVIIQIQAVVSGMERIKLEIVKNKFKEEIEENLVRSLELLK
ncbi:metal-sensitive transcriptional regulator [Candidatus Dojkabacteria bacterium]|nr:metal-sensitive transcriptional regulator [Candidatus Dojkabacteria bacterium]